MAEINKNNSTKGTEGRQQCRLAVTSTQLLNPWIAPCKLLKNSGRSKKDKQKRSLVGSNKSTAIYRKNRTNVGYNQQQSKRLTAGAKGVPSIKLGGAINDFRESRVFVKCNGKEKLIAACCCGWGTQFDFQMSTAQMLLLIYTLRTKYIICARVYWYAAVRILYIYRWYILKLSKIPSIEPLHSLNSLTT